mgnify:CR=1 FL=1
MKQLAICATIFAILAIGSPAWASTLRFLGSYAIPTDEWSYEDALVGGISGLAYDASRDVYYGVNDDQGILYTLKITIDENGIHDVEVLGMTRLDSNQITLGIQPYEEGNIDAETVVLAPDDTLIISSELDHNGNPWIRTFALDGALLGQIPIPRKFIPIPSLTQGVRPDLAFEALALTPTGNTLYVANEQALGQDYPTATVSRGTVVRIIEYNMSHDMATVTAEYPYRTEPIFVVPVGGTFAENGVSAMLSVKHLMPKYDLLVMERGYSNGVGYDIKLFGVTLAGATNIMNAESLPCLCSTRTVKKTLLLQISAEPGYSNIPIQLDNMEAMTIGPKLANGHYTLILASDNNFDDSQGNLFLAFEILP